jgi:hypothetical protein
MKPPWPAKVSPEANFRDKRSRDGSETHDCKAAEMGDERAPRALSSFLLRVLEVRIERTERIYELHDLRSGVTHRFKSPAGLRRFLASVDELRARR